VIIAVQSANRAVIERGAAEPGKTGMGTTLTAVHVIGRSMLVGHVGDSRLYRLRGNSLQQLTRDHTVADEMIARGALTPIDAMQHPANSILTRSLGSRADVDIDEMREDLWPGDVLLLCSDGLTAMVTDEDIQMLLGQSRSLEERARGLIDAANSRGGVDNITVLLIGV
jgi:protein phosphatase